MLSVIGLMSGTSMDGIDLAMLRTDGVQAIDRGPTMFVPYEAAFRYRLQAALDTARTIKRRNERPGDLALLERDITLRHAEAVNALLEGPGAGWPAPDLIGFHGQTVLHRPDAGLTVQLGDGELLAAMSKRTVVYDMRENDVLHGGQGAPLVPAYHAALARSLSSPFAGRWPMVLVNVGGISNVTWIPEEGDPVAFDSGPGNALIDQWVSREGGVPYDQDGTIASEGEVDCPVVERYLANAFFEKTGPKSLDRNDFTLDLASGMELADGARTLAAVSAQAILKAAERFPARPKLWVVCGGGRKNPFIVGDLKHGAAGFGADVLLAEEVGLDGDSMEAEAWAYLAVRALKGMPLTFPTTTGCREPVSGGIVVQPPPTGG
jgi:anhydro-N-acetylmuramic acid kinase